MRAFGSAGASLPHSAAAQAHYGKAVSLGSIRAGDLVFFGRPISHVGIYLGGGKWLTHRTLVHELELKVLDRDLVDQVL